jgi:hypothetical protein
MAPLHNYVSYSFRATLTVVYITSRSLVLYLIYYPSHLKYGDTYVDTHNTRPPQLVKSKSDEWRLSVILSWVVVVHMHVISKYSSNAN